MSLGMMTMKSTKTCSEKIELQVCYMDAPKPVYENLFELLKDKDYFVLTTNVDHCFQKAGFAKERLFYTQGGLWTFSMPDSMQAVYLRE